MERPLWQPWLVGTLLSVVVPLAYVIQQRRLDATGDVVQLLELLPFILVGAGAGAGFGARIAQAWGYRRAWLGAWLTGSAVAVAACYLGIRILTRS